MSARTQADELHAIGWQATGETARQISLMWFLVQQHMPASDERVAIAEAYVGAMQMLKMQDIVFADLAAVMS